MTTRRPIVLMLALLASGPMAADLGKRPFGTRYVQPGRNTLSEAARGLMDGGTLMLGVGRYEQTEPVEIPEGIQSFSVLGAGPGSSRVAFTADCDGIITSTSGRPADAIERCRIEGLTLAAEGSSGERTAIRVWSAETNFVMNPSTVIRNVSIERSASGYWGVGVDLIDAKEFLIQDVHIRHMPRMSAGYQAKGVGVRLQSCVCGSIRDTQVNEARLGIDLCKAEDKLIRNPIKHGCEGVVMDGCVLFKVVDGIELGYRALNINIDQTTLAHVQRYAIFEPAYDGMGGFHQIKACWIDTDPVWAAEGGAAVQLLRTGSIVDGLQVVNQSPAMWHGVVLGSGAVLSGVDKCLFQGCGYGVLAQGSKSTITRNKCWATKGGASILLGLGSGQNVVGGNVTDRGVVDQGQGNKVVDGVGY